MNWIKRLFGKSEKDYVTVKLKIPIQKYNEDQNKSLEQTLIDHIKVLQSQLDKCKLALKKLREDETTQS